MQTPKKDSNVPGQNNSWLNKVTETHIETFYGVDVKKQKEALGINEQPHIWDTEPDKWI